MTSNRFRIRLKEDGTWLYPETVTSDQMSYYFNEGFPDASYVPNGEVSLIECVNCGGEPGSTHDDRPWWASHECPPDDPED